MAAFDASLRRAFGDGLRKSDPSDRSGNNDDRWRFGWSDNAKDDSLREQNPQMVQDTHDATHLARKKASVHAKHQLATFHADKEIALARAQLAKSHAQRATHEHATRALLAEAEALRCEVAGAEAAEAVARRRQESLRVRALEMRRANEDLAGRLAAFDEEIARVTSTERLKSTVVRERLRAEIEWRGKYVEGARERRRLQALHDGRQAVHGDDGWRNADGYRRYARGEGHFDEYYGADGAASSYPAAALPLGAGGGSGAGARSPPPSPPPSSSGYPSALSPSVASTASSSAASSSGSGFRCTLGRRTLEVLLRSPGRRRHGGGGRPGGGNGESPSATVGAFDDLLS